jgi:hypothetical protein
MVSMTSTNQDYGAAHPLAQADAESSAPEAQAATARHEPSSNQIQHFSACEHLSKIGG